MGSVEWAVRTEIYSEEMLKFVLIILVAKSVNSLRCKACTSDNGNNVACEINAENVTSTECEGDKDRCYVMVQKIKTAGDLLTWNRSCCKLKANAPDCPSNKPLHQENEYFEIWRKFCSDDDCNIMDPSKTSENGGGKVYVRGGSSANSIIGSMVMIVSAVFVINRF